MIFATIGTQAPFDRFVRMLDELCEGMEEEVIVQTIGEGYKARNIKMVGFLPPDEFNDYFSRARLIISHAGMGTILSSMRQGKPIIIVPRLASWHEHRNDHQMATAMRLDELGYVNVAYDKKQLRDLMFDKSIKVLKHIDDKASDRLINSIKEYIGE